MRTRALLTGASLSCLIPLMAHWSIGVTHASWLAIDQMPVAPIFLFFALALCARRWLTPPELRLVYAMMLMAAAVTTMGLCASLIPGIAAPDYYATPENGWAQNIAPHIPAWLTPGPEAARAYFLGGRFEWRAWALPLAAWGVFFAAAWTAMLAAMSVLRRQWVEHEHLPYPLTALADGLAGGGLLRSRGMWLGFALAFIIASTAALKGYYLATPQIGLVRALPVFRFSNPLILRLSLPVLGFALLVNRDVLFSLWACYLAFYGIGAALNQAGVGLTESLGPFCASPIPGYIGFGALAAFALSGLWTARHNVRLSNHRAAVWGTAAALCIMWGWLCAAGMPWWTPPVFLAVAYIIYIGLTRIVCESGLPTVKATMIAPVLVVSLFGSRAFGAAGVVALALMHTWTADPRIFPMAQAAQGFKLNGGGRRVIGGMALALGVSFVASVAVALWLGHTRGALYLNQWFNVNGPQMPLSWAATVTDNPVAPSLAGYALMALGACATFGVVAARAVWPWFPLHPIGLAVGPTFLMDNLWFSIFLAWAVKSLVLRYGGPIIYRRAVPYALGLPLGTYVAAGAWFVVDVLTGTRGNAVFWL